MFKYFFHSRNERKSLKKNGNRNRAALEALRELGYPENNVRKALFNLNGISVQTLAKGVSAPTLYAALKGKSDHDQALTVLAEAVGLNIEDLFPQQAVES
jgi:hypothetical protein